MSKHKVSIEYCVQWNYTPKAVSLAEELLNNYTPVIDGLTMIPSGKGRFEVVVDGDLIYSKVETGRHAEAGEVAGFFANKTGAEATPFS